MPEGHWDRFAGTRPDAEHPERLRAVRYADASGVDRGVALYTFRENHDDFARSKVRVDRLVAETPDAYAALGGSSSNSTSSASSRRPCMSVQEPVLWMIADRRAARLWVGDHQWVRILDVPAALQARRYASPGALALEVTDALGFAEGRWILRVGESGAGSVEPWRARRRPTASPPSGSASPSSPRSTSARCRSPTLAAAGRVQSTDAAAAARIFSWFETGAAELLVLTAHRPDGAGQLSSVSLSSSQRSSSCATSALALCGAPAGRAARSSRRGSRRA